MGNQVIITVIFLVGIFLLLLFNEMVYKRLGITGEFTRKFAHMTGTLSTISFPYLYSDHWYVLFLAIIFFILLFVSKRSRRHLRSIHDINRNSIGSYLLPIAIYLTFLVSFKLESKLLFILPMLVLAICDPMAGILGINITTHNHQIVIFKKKLQKTWLGSLSFFISCFLISIIALYLYNLSFNLQTFYLAIIIAFVGTLAEMFSWKGSDNLFVPMSVMIVLLIAG
jgi:phytol kinase